MRPAAMLLEADARAARRARKRVVDIAVSLPKLDQNIAGAAAILIVLFVYRTATTWPGLIIALLGVPVYFAWKPKQ